jgi:hypothetical protein
VVFGGQNGLGLRLGILGLLIFITIGTQYWILKESRMRFWGVSECDGCAQVTSIVTIVYGMGMDGSQQGLEEVKGLIEIGRLMIESGTPTWKGKKNHRTSTIDLVISSHEADISTAEIATDLYTGSDHETICWEINEGYNSSDRGKLRKAAFYTVETTPTNKNR